MTAVDNRLVSVQDVMKDVRILKILASKKLDTLGDIAAMTQAECHSLPYIGDKGVCYIQEALAVHGLLFRQSTVEEILEHRSQYFEDL